MRKWNTRRLLFLAATAAAGCDIATDAATRMAFDIEAGAGRLGRENGATYRIRHDTPSKPGECVGPYTVQLDKMGALIVWCRDAAGLTVSSHGTSFHARFVDTPQTYIVEKAAGTSLIIDIERRNGRAVVTDVR